MAARAPARMGRYGWKEWLAIGAATALLTFTLTALSFGTPSASTPRHAMTLPLVVHIATVLPALPLGAWLLVRRKGGRTHRVLGRVWAGLMVTTAIASFWLQDTGRLSLIHIFSVTTLISIPLAIFWIRRGDVERHRRAITGVYIGLVVAGLFAFTPGRMLGGLLFG